MVQSLGWQNVLAKERSPNVVLPTLLSRDQWYWTNTLQQVSDGLTKVQARQRLVEILRRGYHALKFDPTFTAGKKLTTEQR